MQKTDNMNTKKRIENYGTTENSTTLIAETLVDAETVLPAGNQIGNFVN